MVSIHIKGYELQTYLGEDNWPSLPFKEPFGLHHVNDLRGEFLHLSLFKIDPRLKKRSSFAVILERRDT
jgi:hypothetical protein